MNKSLKIIVCLSRVTLIWASLPVSSPSVSSYSIFVMVPLLFLFFLIYFFYVMLIYEIVFLISLYIILQFLIQTSISHEFPIC